MDKKTDIKQTAAGRAMDFIKALLCAYVVTGILLLVLAVICVCFAAYIMYTHRKQENQGGGQR